MSTASSLSSARSRPDMLSPATGGLYLLTVAGRRIPFERMTEIDGSSLTFALATAAASAWGESSPHASRTALRACWSATHAGVWLAGDTRCAFVIIHPLGLMNQPVPVSRNGAGRMSFSQPPPQVTMTAEPTSATTRERVGFARSLRLRPRLGLGILTTRRVRVLLATRSLGVLTAWSLGLLTTRSLHVLLATRSLCVLTARSLRLLTTRGLNILLATRSLGVLTARSLRLLTTRGLN